MPTAIGNPRQKKNTLNRIFIKSNLIQRLFYGLINPAALIMVSASNFNLNPILRPSEEMLSKVLARFSKNLLVKYERGYFLVSLFGFKYNKISTTGRARS